MRIPISSIRFEFRESLIYTCLLLTLESRLGECFDNVCGSLMRRKLGENGMIFSVIKLTFETEPRKMTDAQRTVPGKLIEPANEACTGRVLAACTGRRKRIKPSKEKNRTGKYDKTYNCS